MKTQQVARESRTRKPSAPARHAGPRGIVIRGLRRPRLSVNVASVSDQVGAAINANTAILTSVNAMSLTELPNVLAPSLWWKQFAAGWNAAQSTALEWINSVGPDFTVIPQSIMNFNLIFQVNVAVIRSACAALEQNPNDSAAKSALQSALQVLTGIVTSEETAATQFASEITSFAGALSNDAAGLTAIVQNALQSGIDQQPILMLQSQIAELQAQIMAYSQPPSSNEAPIFVMAAGIRLPLLQGPAFLYGAGVSAPWPTILNQIIGNPSIQAAQANIAAAVAALSPLEQQVAVLNALANMAAGIVLLIESAQNGVQAILNAWSEVQSDVQSVLTELQAAAGEVSGSNWSQLAADAGEALADWNSLQTVVQGLAGFTYHLSSSLTLIPGSN